MPFVQGAKLFYDRPKFAKMNRIFKRISPLSKKPVKTKKAAAKKAVKKTAKKSIKKRTVKAVKKSSPKKAAKKVAKKKSARKLVKKSPTKKSPVKKLVKKRAAPKKVAAKKAAPKKAPAKKLVAKKIAPIKLTPKAAPTKIAQRYVGPAWPLMDVILSTLDDAKAEDTVAIHLQGRSSMADGMVVTTGRVNRHVAAIADQLLTKLKQHGTKNVRVEGLEAGDWCLVDAGDIIIHIFRPEVRLFYNLEKLWSADAPKDLA